MEGNLSGGSMMSGPFGVLDMHGSLHPHQHHPQHPHSIHHQQHMQDGFPLSVGAHLGHDSDQQQLGMVGVGHRTKNCTSDEDEPSFTEEDGGGVGGGSGGKGKKNSPWQRMKWTDSMVRLLITVVYYIGEDSTPDCGRRKLALLQKKGKWKAVSRVMAARGCYVSPQQCEDKFNDLNKRYKRLTDVLGRGTSCKVVENPTLLDSMSNLSEKAKEDVRKILSSKHLFYEEMCSYHNGNRLNLMDDPSLQQCLQSVLEGREVRDPGRIAREENGGNDHDEDDLDDDDDEGDDGINLQGEDGLVGAGHIQKRLRLQHNLEEANFWMPANSQESGKRPCPDNHPVEKNESMQRQWIRSRTLQLEEQKLSIQAQALELENQRFKWQRFSRKKERELDKLRLENERVKLENERMLLDLRKKEMEVDFHRSDAMMSSGSLGMDRLQRGE